MFMRSQLCCAEIMLCLHTPSIVCSLQCWFCRLSGNVLLVRILLQQLHSARVLRSRRTKCWYPFYIWRLLSVTQKYFEPDSIRLKFSNSCKEHSSTFYSQNSVKSFTVKNIVLRLHFRCIPVVTTALVATFLKNYWQWGPVSFFGLVLMT